MHRIIMGCPKGLCIDHINHNGYDNRKCNLRICTLSENQQNKRMQKNNKTGITGVINFRDKYVAKIQFQNKTYHLGIFKNIEDAITARKKAEEKYFTKINKTLDK